MQTITNYTNKTFESTFLSHFRPPPHHQQPSIWNPFVPSSHSKQQTPHASCSRPPPVAARTSAAMGSRGQTELRAGAAKGQCFGGKKEGVWCFFLGGGGGFVLGLLFSFLRQFFAGFAVCLLIERNYNVWNKTNYRHERLSRRFVISHLMNSYDIFCMILHDSIWLFDTVQ